MKINCIKCDVECNISDRTYKKYGGVYTCHSCKCKSIWTSEHRAKQRIAINKLQSSDQWKQRQSESQKIKWEDEEYKRHQSLIQSNKFSDNQYKQEHSDRMKEVWDRPEYRKSVSDRETQRWQAMSDDDRDLISKKFKAKWTIEERQKQSDRQKAIWTDDLKQHMRDKANLQWSNVGLRVSASKSMKLLWLTDEYRSKYYKSRNSPEFRSMMAQLRSQQPRCSSIQAILYSILDDLGAKYFREYPDKEADKETVIGPWSFDCVIPREGKPTLLIECQGDYWHSRKETISRDQAKSSYISSTFQDQYELKTIWEHEFKCCDKVTELVKYWLGITEMEVVNFDFKDIIIKSCMADEYRPLLGKYHYLKSAGNGGIAYGAYLNDELVGCVVYSPLPRQNINIDGFKRDEVRELSRLCIHPKYQKKNFASWLIAQSLKLLNGQYRCIISYSDETFNHAGTIYKASNFINDHVVEPDYWYVNSDGWKMHKKTLYNQAVKIKLTEKKFAEDNGYTRVFGKKKKRWVYKR